MNSLDLMQMQFFMQLIATDGSEVMSDSFGIKVALGANKIMSLFFVNL